MPYKVYKKGSAYAVVGDGYGAYHVVDIQSGLAVVKSWYLGSAKSTMQWLESGIDQPEQYVGHMGFGKPVDMPESLKKQQKKLLKQQAKKAKASKAIGTASKEIVEVDKRDYFTIVKMKDGTYGVFVPSTGASKFGMTSLRGASRSGWTEVRKMAGSKLGTMGVDPGSDAVDTLLGVYESRVREMYEQAALEMAEKQAKFLKEFDGKRQEMLGKVRAGAITQDQYDGWLRGQTTRGEWYGQMVDGLSNDLVSADVKAMQMLNGYVPSAYAANMNYATFQIESQAKVNTGFTLYNEQAVSRLISDPDGSLLPDLPDPKTKIPVDEKWCRQKISACTAQSILQGESVPHAAARLQAVVGMSANSAMRAARTALTGAQNLGRLDAGRRAKAMGIELKKQWVATVDARTRHSHRQIDRETVELEEGFSNGCDCPGDPSGPPSEVYNCRCGMRYVLPGHEYDDLPEFSSEGLSYEEWKNEHQAKTDKQIDDLKQQLDQLNAQEAALKAALPENKTYSGIWKSPVTLDDYEAKKGSIAAKEEYYLQQLLNAPSGHSGDAVAYDAKKKLLQLHEFQEKGSTYADAKGAVESQLGAIKEQKNKVNERLKKLGAGDAYSEERKAAALRWADKKEADDVLRRYTSDAWLAATERERRAVYGYTAGSGKYNRPLSGFRGGWGPSSYKGVGNVDLDYEGGAEAIRDMTRFLQKSSFDDDVWLRRGCGNEAMESFFGLDFGTLGHLTDDELQGFVGHSNRIMGFVSCGTTADGSAGFGGSCDLRIFVPSGTQAVYAEPFSAYSGASYKGLKWDGMRGQNYFGSEDETIIQRGASYTCTKVERKGYNSLYVELEVHPEDGYDTFGQEG